jgi:Receptor family ligand binding region
MYDAVSVMIEAFNKALKRKPDMFRSNVRRGQVFNNGSRGLECNYSKNWVTPWEHGDKISKNLRKVSKNYCAKIQQPNYLAYLKKSILLQNSATGKSKKNSLDT